MYIFVKNVIFHTQCDTERFNFILILAHLVHHNVSLVSLTDIYIKNKKKQIKKKARNIVKMRRRYAQFASTEIYTAI